MTFKGFKNSLEAKLKPLGDVNLPNDELLKPLIKEALDEVAEFCEPFHLQTDDLDFEVLKLSSNLEDGEFIREPNIPQNEDDIIDIDEKLCSAVVYLVLHQISKIRKNSDKKAKKIMINYTWDMYRICEGEDE